MTIRKFKKSDAEFCFRTRCSAFIQKFYNEIGAEAVTAGVNAFMPDDYIRMSNEMEFFIAEEGTERKGFFMVKRIDRNTAEVPLIYFDLKCLGMGYGSRCIKYIEGWISSNWSEVSRIIIDTIIPKYNGEFYKKMGYGIEGDIVYIFPEKELKAIRFFKRLK